MSDISSRPIQDESISSSIVTEETESRQNSVKLWNNQILSHGLRRCAQGMKKSAQRRCRIDGRKIGKDTFSWIRNQPANGYIRHPDAKWLMHPSFFEDEYKLCPYNARCTHQKDCGETRLRMAAMSYLRNKDKTSFRDLELIWGVSRSTIQRRTNDIRKKARSDIFFLLS